MNTIDTAIGYALGYNDGIEQGGGGKPPLPPDGMVAWTQPIELLYEDRTQQTITLIDEVKYSLNLSTVTVLDIANYETNNTRGYIEYG